MARDRTEVLLERLRWLDDNIVGLERDKRRAPYLSATLLLVPFAWIWKGGLAGLLVAITSIGLASVAWYVVWAHHHEYTTERLSVRRELKQRGVSVEASDDDEPDR
jgi:hypothetical protein